jgi:hypothetical protein
VLVEAQQNLQNEPQVDVPPYSLTDYALIRQMYSTTIQETKPSKYCILLAEPPKAALHIALSSCKKANRLLTQCAEALVDGLCLLEPLASGAALLHALTASQVNQVQHTRHLCEEKSVAAAARLCVEGAQ